VTYSVIPTPSSTQTPAAFPASIPLPAPVAGSIPNPAPVAGAGFAAFNLAAPLTRALAEENYTRPTPIQLATIPVAMSGRDVVGIAQTGTGKTAAFALPILHRLAGDRRRVLPGETRVLVLSPTRELSGQILDSFRAYGRHLRPAAALAIGGVPIHGQRRAVAHGIEILVATPGRLLDLVDCRALRLDRVEVLVLDEADRMLDMGFIRDIRRIVALTPPSRQTLFFSATMPREIADLAGQMLRDPARVAVTPVASTAERVSQRVIHVERAAKPQTLAGLLEAAPQRLTLVFTRTKHGADKVVRYLNRGGLAAEAIHGNKSQNQRERVLAGFRAGRIKTLVATDIAARGIDVDGIGLVVNYDLPNIPESYVHRIGRTARAGATGEAVSLCSGEERAFLRDIEKLIRQNIPASGRPQVAPAGAHPQAVPAGARPYQGPPRGNGRPSRGGFHRGQRQGEGRRQGGGQGYRGRQASF